MKKSKAIFLFTILSALVTSVYGQLYVKNSTNNPISIAVGWYSENSSCYVTKGWYNIEPGQTIDPGMTFTSSDDYFFYYAKGWEGSYKFLTNSDAFNIKNADKQYVKDDNPSYTWAMFRKKEVHFDFLEKKTFTLNLTESSSAGTWEGKYSYEVPGPVAYNLTINNDNSCIYEGEGIQTFFKVSCKGKIVGNAYEIYYVKTIDGAFYPADWIDKNKPIMTLYYNAGKLYTDEGQLNKEKQGGQILFKKKK